MKHRNLCVIIIVAVIMLSLTHMSPSYDLAYGQKSTGSKQSTGPQLALFVVPPKVPADGDSYNNIYIAVMDSQKNPSAVGDRLEVRLSSSTTRIGTVDSSAVIEAGSYYTVAKFNSTETAGATTIYATASGFASAQATVTTVKSSDRNPAKINVIALPSPPLPQEGAEGVVIVQLLNSSDLPVVPSEDFKVSLSSSNTNVLKVDPSVVIPKGQIYATAKYQTGLGSGQSTVVASADALAPGTVTISTGDSTASRLKLYSIPPTISTSGTDGGWVVIQLEDSSGLPVRSSTDIEISLLSSDDSIVIPNEPSVVIRKGQSFVVAKITPRGNEGKASLTPIAAGFLSVPGDVSAMKPTFEPGQRQLMIYTAPPNPGSASDRVLVAVQVQGKGNAPAPTFRTTNVQVSSSNANFAKFNDDLVIVGNDSFGIASLDLIGFTGETTVTASAANFQTKQIQVGIRQGAGSVIDLVPTSQNIPAYNVPYPAFLVILKSGGIPVKAPTDINIFLSLNSDLASVPSVVKIAKGSSFSVVNMIPEGFPGTVTVTAKAEGFADVIKTLTLMEFNPSSITIFTAFPTLLPSSDESNDLIIVQLQDSRGEPKKNLVSDTEVSLSLYPNTVGTVQPNLVIPKGANFATTKIFMSTSQGDATVTANAEGFKLASAKFKTIIFPLEVNLEIQPTVLSINQPSTLVARVTSEGKPVPDAQIKWVYNESLGNLTSISERTDATGEATAIFKPTQNEPQQVSASVSKAGYTEKSSSITLSLGEKASNRPQFSMDLLSVVLVTSIVAEGLVIYHFYQKKKPLF